MILIESKNIIPQSPRGYNPFAYKAISFYVYCPINNLWFLSQNPKSGWKTTPPTSLPHLQKMIQFKRGHTMEIAPNVHRLTGFIANQYLIISNNELTLIDAGLPGNHKRILAYIGKIGFEPTLLKRILLTHADGDHSAAVGDLKTATQATVYASQPEAQAIRAGISSRPLKPRGLQKPLYALSKRIIPTLPNPVDEILVPNQVLPILEGLKVLDTAGHTPGHLSFYLPDNGILFAGDSIWNSRSGPTAYTTTANTWNTELAKASFEKQMALKPKMIAAGHFCSVGEYT